MEANRHDPAKDIELDRAAPPRDPAALLGWLTPALKATLADLAQAPPSIANAVVQLLPFGSRAALLELGLAERHTGTPTDEPQASLRLTPLAHRVMRAAAFEADADPSGVDALLRQAQEVADYRPR